MSGSPMVADDKLGSLKVYTTGQIGRLTGAACRTVAKWIDTGRLKGYRLPGSMDRRVKRDVLIAFLRENGMPTDLIGASAAPVALLIGLGGGAAVLAARHLGPGWVVAREGSAVAGVAAAITRRPACVVLGPTLGASACREVAEAVRSALPACVIAAQLADDDPGGRGCYDVEIRGDFAPLAGVGGGAS